MLNGKKIFISSCGGLGDLIMFTPALRVLKDQYPACKITFMTSSKHKEVLAGLTYIDKIVCIYRNKPLGRYRVISDISQQDYVIFTDWQPQLLLATWIFHVPRRIGIPKPNHRLNRFFTKQLIHNVYNSSQYAAKTNAEIFSEALECHITGDMTKCDVALPLADDVKNANHLLQTIGIAINEPYILLSPFAGLEQRNWPIYNVKNFIERFESEYKIPVVIIGPDDKQSIAEKVTKKCLVGKTSILEMIALIRQAKLLITPDSGPMHIAGALGTPVIPLFSKDLPSRWAPQKKCWPITLNLPCSPCDDYTARHCLTVKCMHDITAEMVLDVVRKASIVKI